MTISELKQLSATDGWVDFSGQIIKVGEIKQRTKSEMSKTPGERYNVQKLSIADKTDNISVWAYATIQFLPNQNVKVRGMLKEYEGVRYIDYAKVEIGASTAQPPAQNAPQGVPQPRQSPQAAKGVSQYPKDEMSKREWNDKEMREKRGYAIRDAVLVKTTLASVSQNIATHLSEDIILALAERFVEYVYRGLPKGGQPNPAESKKMADKFEAEMGVAFNDIPEF